MEKKFSCGCWVSGAGVYFCHLHPGPELPLVDVAALKKLDAEELAVRLAALVTLGFMTEEQAEELRKG